jgi:hypothetical protein
MIEMGQLSFDEMWNFLPTPTACGLSWRIVENPARPGRVVELCLLKQY